MTSGADRGQQAVPREIRAPLAVAGTALAMVIALLATALLDVEAGIAAAIVLGTAATSALVMGWALVASSVHYATDTLGGFCIAVAVVPLTAWCTDLVGDRITADYRVGPPA